jgi:membrane protein
MMTLFGLFTSHSTELQDKLLSYFADFLPSDALRLLRVMAAEVASHASSGKLSFGIVFSLWCVSGGISAMIRGLNLAYRVQESRSWFKVRAIALELSVFISILLLATLLLVLAGNHLVDWLGRGLQLPPVVIVLWKGMQWPVVILFVAISCSLIYYFGPDLKERRRWTWLSPGSAFGAILWAVASFGFRMYLHFFDNYTASYGSLGALMMLLSCLYVAGLAYLIGGEINAAIEHSERHSWPAPLSSDEPAGAFLADDTSNLRKVS